MILYWLNLLVTFSLFCGVCVRLLQTPRPGRCWKCRLESLLWTLAHGIVAMVVLAIAWDNIFGPMTAVTPRYLAMKAALAVLFLYPWNTKVVGL